MTPGVTSSLGEHEEMRDFSSTPRSFLSFVSSPSLEKSPKSAENHPRSYYKGFYRALHHGIEPSTEKSSVDKSFTSAFFSQFFLSALPFGASILIMRYIWIMARSVGADGFQKMINPPRSFLSSHSKRRNPFPVVDTSVEKKIKSKTKFSDIIGIDEAKEEVMQYISFLNDPSKFTRLGARLPKGCLFTGPSGTGKTLMVKAIAAEADVPLFTATGADFINVYLGSGPKMVRQLFDEARANAPSIVFIDEIDAVGDRKQASQSPGSMEDNRTINQLLKELDGLHFASVSSNQSSSPPVVVFAATNFSSSIDPALLRAGRFDRKIVFPLPDYESRTELFRYYLSKAKLKQSIQQNPPSTYGESFLSHDQKQLLSHLADLSAGLSPAAISTIVNNACLSAADDSSEKSSYVTEKHLIESLEKVLLGKHSDNENTSSSSSHTSTVLVRARQESARVLIAWMFPEQQDVVRVSIGTAKGRSGASGTYTLQKQEESGSPVTVLHLFSSMCVHLAAQASEHLSNNSTSQFHLTGSMQKDTRTATARVFDQVLSYGMVSKKLGMLSHRDSANRPDGQVETAVTNSRQKEAEDLVAARMSLGHQIVVNILIKYGKELSNLEKTLTESGSLRFAEIEKILGPRPLSSPLGKEELKKIDDLYSGCCG
ncbi:ATP-dependent zinc metallopeptidase [Perkinsela sp. CCAP 1560/4]|nr:ATP-dependent zinc metallopeptidase [Perkinsela sp. CCAP 1560/4]|eukprot:KNH04461.1 ATP-dependent zinc metallopeptidase [Perkinsela sp. CCAP 1560/4]